MTRLLEGLLDLFERTDRSLSMHAATIELHKMRGGNGAVPKELWDEVGDSLKSLCRAGVLVHRRRGEKRTRYYYLKDNPVPYREGPPVLKEN